MLRDSNLDGYTIPNVRDRLIAMLFADDTTIWSDLQAKFNIEKTKLVTTRRMSPEQEPIPMDIHVIQDGDVVRILGAFVGNAMDTAAPWAPILDRIQEKFEAWDRTHPTIEGRRLLIQMYAGGMTQFLTRAQGMPSQILMQLQKMISEFAWDNQGKAPVNKTILAAAKQDGGMQVLDISIRNQAIEVMRLKSYLQLDERHPKAAYVKDAIINKYIRKGTPRTAAMANTILQTWTVNLQHNT
ncbi:hypothetical protein EV421DRAFT_1892885 [Armillaria borealis]|uniref:Reverse transcriptase domain-containing protein n=1 Tax=Armillaria borealis TaxID=47425 RepID=A0AA39J1B8_9AGAR|nr:hypothetical protein EV421DRAFT_1892885 [Armillaria borealis]